MKKAVICSLPFYPATNLFLKRIYTDALNNGAISRNSQRKLINYLSEKGNPLTRKSNCPSITMTAYNETLINPTKDNSQQSQLIKMSNFPHFPRNTINHSNYFLPANYQQHSSLLTVHSLNLL